MIKMVRITQWKRPRECMSWLGYWGEVWKGRERGEKETGRGGEAEREEERFNIQDRSLDST